jgi:serine/threonine protein kinase
MTKTEIEEETERFVRGAQIACSLSHPGIAQIYHYGTEEKCAYVVMELSRSVTTTLANIIYDSDSASGALFFRQLVQGAAALDYCHGKGIIHRNVKPSKFLVDADGFGRLIDFDLACDLAESIRPGTIRGTPHYMSPEQIRGGKPDGRSDQFSLAVIAFEGLTGHRPFDHGRIEDLFHKILWEEPRRPDELNPAIGAGTAEVLLRGLSKQFTERYRTCGDFVSELLSAYEGFNGPVDLPRWHDRSSEAANSSVIRPIQYFSCFISYSRKDIEFAMQLYRDLERHGLKCWFAEDDLKIGDRFRARIDQVIRIYDKSLVILSQNSIASNWVEEEVEGALEEEHRRGNPVLFPIRIDDSVMKTTEAWASEIRRTRHIGDFKNWRIKDDYEAAFSRLIRDLAITQGKQTEARGQ